MKKYSFLIFLTLFCSILYPQNSNSNYESKLRESINLIFNFDLDRAEIGLKNILNHYKDDARPLLYLSNIYVWKFIGDKEKNDFERFENFSRQTIEKSEAIIKKNPEDLWSYYCLSSIYGYRSLMYFMSRNYADGIWSVSKSISWSNKLIEKHPDFIDGYLWRGIINFSLHQVPSAFRGLLSIIGMDNNIKQGLRDIQLVAKKGDLAKIEANYFLSQFYSFSLNENQKAYEILADLIKEFPDNELFVYSTAIELIKLGRIDEASVLLKKIINNKSVEIKAIQDLSFFLLGDCAFYKSNYEEAVSYYELFSSRYNQNEYLPTAYFRCAISYYFLNDKLKARKYLEKAISIKSKVEEDKFHARYANKFLVSNFNNDLLKIFLGWNFLRSGDLNSSIKFFMEIFNQNLDPDYQIVVTYLIGLSYYKLNDFSNAKKYLKETLKFESKQELWAKAFAYLYLARISFKGRDFQTSKNYLTKLFDLEDYDFKNSVRSQAKNLLERLENDF